MASTGILNGTLAKIQIGGTTVAYLTSNGIEKAMATRDISNKDSAGWKEVREAQKSWSISGEAFFAEDAAYGYEDISDIMDARTQVTVTYTTNVAGDQEYTGSGYVTGLSRTDGLEESTTFSITIEGTGALTKQVVV